MSSKPIAERTRMNFEEMVAMVKAGRDTKVCDSSERRHLFEFLSDICDNVEYDIESGNYSDEEKLGVLRQQLIGSLEELKWHAELISKALNSVKGGSSNGH